MQPFVYDPTLISEEFASASIGYLSADHSQLPAYAEQLHRLIGHGPPPSLAALVDLQGIIGGGDGRVAPGKLRAWCRENRIKPGTEPRELGIYSAVRWGIENQTKWRKGQRPFQFKRRYAPAMWVAEG